MKKWMTILASLLLLSGCGAKEDTFSLSAAEQARPLRHCWCNATSPKGRGFGSPCKVSGFARGSPFGRAGREAA